jgi:membrane protease YdiL (CAAX protease family)
VTKQSEIIKHLSDRELVLNLYITQFIMLLAALILSRFIFESWFYPFTLISWNLNHLLIGAGAGLFIVLIELAAVRYLPKSWFDDGGINERMFKNRSPYHIVFLSFVIGFSEELLFRGVLQTSIGFIPASLIFALIHFRYLDNFFLFSFTVGMSFFLGYLFLVTGNLLTVILCHMVIDMLLGGCIRYGLLDKIRKTAV